MAFPIEMNSLSKSSSLETSKIQNPCKKPNPSPLRIEPILAHKIYDSCKAQDCAAVVAYATKPVCINEKHIQVGDVLPVPHGVGTVEIENLILKDAIITNKKPAPFKMGYWDVEVKFIFEYDLIYKNCDHEIMLCVRAFSNFTKRYHLFGSIGVDTTTASDFFGYTNVSATGEPFAMTQAKAIALKAEFRNNHRDRKPVDVIVTIGVFSTMKLFRIVGLNVESKGFCIPKECEPLDPLNPCQFFEGLEFPMETFLPREK